MKKLQILAVAVTIFLAACESTKTYTGADAYSNVDMVTPPLSAQDAFTGRYPNAANVRWYAYDPSIISPVEWDLTDWQVLGPRDYVVTYSLDNNNYYSWYDANGNWVGTTYTLGDYHTMPSGVASMLADRYPGYTVNDVQTAYWKDRTAYQVNISNGSERRKMLVDANGNILKEKTKPM